MNLKFWKKEKKIQALEVTNISNPIYFNDYKTYYYTVQELRRKYLSKSSVGCSLTKNLIDSRVSIIGGSGYDISSRNDSNKEFLEIFRNKILTNIQFINFLKITEIEGKIVLIPIYKNGIFTIKYLSCSLYPYEVVQSKSDYTVIEKIKYRLSYDMGESEIYPESYILGIISGLEDNPNDTISKIGSLLDKIERIDEINAEIKGNNKLFGNPRIENRVTDWQDGIDFQTILNSRGGKWALGDLISNKGEIRYIEPSGNAINSLLQELSNLIKLISATSGISVEKLGFVDLFGTKAGVSEMSESSEIATRLERLAWENIIKELCIFCMKLESKESNRVYDYGDIQVRIPISLTSIIEQKAKTYIELKDAGLISKQTVMELIPNIDAEEETKRIESEKNSNTENSYEFLNNSLGVTDGEQ